MLVSILIHRSPCSSLFHFVERKTFKPLYVFFITEPDSTADASPRTAMLVFNRNGSPFRKRNQVLNMKSENFV